MGEGEDCFLANSSLGVRLTSRAPPTYRAGWYLTVLGQTRTVIALTQINRRVVAFCSFT